jgi:hypothetical protein
VKWRRTWGRAGRVETGVFGAAPGICAESEAVARARLNRNVASASFNPVFSPLHDTCHRMRSRGRLYLVKMSGRPGSLDRDLVDQRKHFWRHTHQLGSIQPRPIRVTNTT